MLQIKKYRELRGLLKAELGKRIGKDGSYINKLESGIGNPTYKTIILLCDALQITPNELLGYGSAEIIANLLDDEKELLNIFNNLKDKKTAISILNALEKEDNKEMGKYTTSMIS